MPVLQNIQPEITLQRWWRGSQTRENYQITPLASSQSTRSLTYLVGNDPKIEGLESHLTSDVKIALVGTSGLRALSLILALSSGLEIPKLIIVDNSESVINFWRELREMVQGIDPLNKSVFIESFRVFFMVNSDLYRNIAPEACTNFDTLTVKYENQDPMLYIESLLEKHELTRITNTIKHASFIHQSWTSLRTFVVLKNILTLNGVNKIIAYPSNIAHCIDPAEAHSVFENIEALSAELSIFTDICFNEKKPKQVFILEKKFK